MFLFEAASGCPRRSAQCSQVTFSYDRLGALPGPSSPKGVPTHDRNDGGGLRDRLGLPLLRRV